MRMAVLLVRAGLWRKRHRCERLEVPRLVLHPIALAVPERVFQPTRVVALMEVGAVVRAARLLAGLRRHYGRTGGLDQVLQLERLDTRGVEHLALVADLDVPNAFRDL